MKIKYTETTVNHKEKDLLSLLNIASELCDHEDIVVENPKWRLVISFSWNFKAKVWVHAPNQHYDPLIKVMTGELYTNEQIVKMIEENIAYLEKEVDNND